MKVIDYENKNMDDYFEETRRYTNSYPYFWNIFGYNDFPILPKRILISDLFSRNTYTPIINHILNY